ncbi:MAG: ABC transporter substrate-binding protein [Candidatus Eremiobacteraeota bacterium]|jgi:putative ABC transport system substrate-binding protein|nr:ABC transporter substrate-binding protein [Candidatus Eremiobacteraeota bacterium]
MEQKKSKTKNKVLILFLVLFLVPFLAFSQSDVLILKSLNVGPYNEAVRGIEKVLPGSASVYNIGGNLQKGREILKEHPGAKVIAAIGWPATDAAVKYGSGRPVVFSMILSEEWPLVQNENATGVFMDVGPQEQLTVLKRAFPDLKSVGVLYNPEKTGPEVENAKTIAQGLGFHLDAVAISSPRQVPQALRKILPHIGALWMVPDSSVLTPDSFMFMNEKMMRYHLPFLVFSSEFVKVGGLFALSPDYFHIGEQTGRMISEVLNGNPISQIPPAYPHHFTLVINMRILRELKLHFPSSMLAAAKRIGE